MNSAKIAEGEKSTFEIPAAKGLVVLAHERAFRAIAAETRAATPDRLDALDTYLHTEEDPDPMNARPEKPEDEKKGKQTAIRLNAADVERLDALAAAMSKAASVEVTRSAAMRSAMLEGLAVLEGRLGIAATKPKKAKPK